MKNKTCGECKKHNTDCIIVHFAPACDFFEPKVITNGDRIRSMSNEELAEFFALAFMCDGCPLKDVECIGDGETARTYAHCYDKLISYINAPADCVSQNGKNDTQADLCIKDDTQDQEVKHE